MPKPRKKGQPFTLSEAAKELGVSEADLRKMAQSGQIRANRLPGGRYRFEEEVIEKERGCETTDTTRRPKPE